MTSRTDTLRERPTLPSLERILRLSGLSVDQGPEHQQDNQTRHVTVPIVHMAKLTKRHHGHIELYQGAACANDVPFFMAGSGPVYHLTSHCRCYVHLGAKEQQTEQQPNVPRTNLRSRFQTITRRRLCYS